MTDSSSPFDRLPAYRSETELNVIVETPKGCRNKYKYEPDLGLFTLHKLTPLGMVFPFDFGFVPATLGDDGDPLDVLLLMDEPACTGCLVASRLVGVIKAEQADQHGTTRNDRLICVASASRIYRDIKSLEFLNAIMLEEIEHFFISYNKIQGKQFKPLGTYGVDEARSIVEDGMKRFGKQ